MFNNTNIIPKYQSIVNIIYSSINTTFNCSFRYIQQNNTKFILNNTESVNVIKEISKKQLGANNIQFSYETIVLLIIGIIISKIASMYLIPTKKNKDI